MFPACQLTLLALLGTALAFPQGTGADEAEEPSMRYTGTPLVLPFDCASDEVADYGLRCAPDEPCEISIELNSVTSARENVFLVGEFDDGSRALASFVLRSADGGRSWDEVHERMPGVSLDHLYFYDDSAGWATGHGLSVPPSDPFFLLTTDGGKHWRRRDVYSKPEVGVIEEFWFDDERSGGLLIDRVQGADAGRRFERYETMTGGASWMIREVSETPIRVRNVVPVGPDPAWRLTNDEERGAWQVEQRQPGGWAAVAEFSAMVAVCQSPPQMASEPESNPPPNEGEPPAATSGVLVIQR